VRYGIFGDIHGNGDALEAVLAEMERQKVDELICLGDIVGYGAQPRECVARIRELGCMCLAGNHDHAAIGKLDIDFFNLYAREAAVWTRAMLSPEDREFLAGQGFVEHLPGFAVVHGSLHGPEMFNYISTIFDADLSFEALDKPVLFYGHTHIPLTFFDTKPMTYTMDAEIPVGDGTRALINVGSVGQPRDEDPRACFAVYDDAEGVVRLIRKEYDVELAARRIVEAGLPEPLAMRLQLGK
jgi:diadenosine tetraphosphatase ApaH/serine/threonine PP2A family protein phosphatase